MKLWIDDVLPAPSDDYIHTYSVNMAKTLIVAVEEHKFGDEVIELIDQITMLVSQLVLAAII